MKKFNFKFIRDQITVIWWKYFINLNIILLLSCLCFNYFYNMKEAGFYFFASFVLSFGISYIIINNIKFPNNPFIKYTIIFFINLISFAFIMVFVGYVGWLWDIYPAIDCSTGESDLIKEFDKQDNTPLVDLLESLFALNIISLFLFVVLLFIIFNRYILKYNFDLISSFVNKYMSKDFQSKFNNRLTKGIDYHNKYVFFMFIFLSIFLILLLLFKIVISAVLYLNISEYVEVHNYLNSKNS